MMADGVADMTREANELIKQLETLWFQIVNAPYQDDYAFKDVHFSYLRVKSYMTNTGNKNWESVEDAKQKLAVAAENITKLSTRRLKLDNEPDLKRALEGLKERVEALRKDKPDPVSTSRKKSKSKGDQYKSEETVRDTESEN